MRDAPLRMIVKRLGIRGRASPCRRRGYCWSRLVHHRAGGERQRVGRRFGRLHADDLGRKAEQVARQDAAADAGALADRHIENVEVRRLPSAVPARRWPRPARGRGWNDGTISSPLRCGAPLGFLARGLKVVAMFDKVGAERLHGAIFLDRIAVRHQDRHRQAVAARRQRRRSGRDCRASPRSARRFADVAALQAVDIDQAAAHLEGAGRGVVLVLDEHRRRRAARPAAATHAPASAAPPLDDACARSSCRDQTSARLTPAPCRRRRRRRWLRHWLRPAAAFRCAPCRTGSSGSSSPASPRGNRTAPASSP